MLWACHRNGSCCHRSSRQRSCFTQHIIPALSKHISTVARSMVMYHPGICLIYNIFAAVKYCQWRPSNGCAPLACSMTAQKHASTQFIPLQAGNINSQVTTMTSVQLSKLFCCHCGQSSRVTNNFAKPMLSPNALTTPILVGGNKKTIIPSGAVKNGQWKSSRRHAIEITMIAVHACRMHAQPVAKRATHCTVI